MTHWLQWLSMLVPQPFAVKSMIWTKNPKVKISLFYRIRLGAGVGSRNDAKTSMYTVDVTGQGQVGK